MPLVELQSFAKPRASPPVHMWAAPVKRFDASIHVAGEKGGTRGETT
jgi:hypothetical protein